MKDVQMKVSDLKKALEKNKKAHRAEFEKALDGWKAKVTEKLEKSYQDALAKKIWIEAFHLPKPQDHTEDYEQAIEMLKHEQRTEITLSTQEYAQFVMDNWGWKQQFTASTAAYTNG